MSIIFFWLCSSVLNEQCYLKLKSMTKLNSTFNGIFIFKCYFYLSSLCDRQLITRRHLLCCLSLFRYWHCQSLAAKSRQHLSVAISFLAHLLSAHRFDLFSVSSLVNLPLQLFAATVLTLYLLSCEPMFADSAAFASINWHWLGAILPLPLLSLVNLLLSVTLGRQTGTGHKSNGELELFRIGAFPIWWRQFCFF